MLNKIVLAAVAVGFMGTTAMAADMMQPPPPDAMMTSGWDGGYIGVDGAIFTPPTGVQADIFAGVNMTVAESFLIGGEASIGAYNLLPGLGIEVSGSLRGGFIASDSVLIYGKLGGALDFGAGAGTRVFVGGGAEFKVSDNMAIRAEGTIDNGGQIQGTIGALWHF
jgi:opacity protein-like surface antigen